MTPSPDPVVPVPVARTLREVRALLLRSERWTKATVPFDPWRAHRASHVYARDRLGRPCEPSDPAARSWSLVGAIELAAKKNAAPERTHLACYRFLITMLGVKATLEWWNDHVRHDNVVAFLNAAVDHAETLAAPSPSSPEAS
jgi:hypothetical protein